MGVDVAGLIGDYRRAVGLFGECLVEIGHDQWENPTPCVEWNVRSLVAHVIFGEALLAALFLGEEEGLPMEVDPTILGPNPVATWRGTALAAFEVLKEESALKSYYSHPNGDFIGETIVGFRVTDNLVHAWDLSRACGSELDLPEDIAERCLEFWLPLADTLIGSGARRDFFAEPVSPPPDPSTGSRLLALLGRMG